VSDWLELELSERLAPVQAPDELWDRVVNGAGKRGRRLLPFAAPIAAVVMLMLAGAIWFMARGQQPSAAFRQFPTSAHADACLLCHNTL